VSCHNGQQVPYRYPLEMASEKETFSAPRFPTKLCLLWPSGVECYSFKSGEFSLGFAPDTFTSSKIHKRALISLGDIRVRTFRTIRCWCDEQRSTLPSEAATAINERMFSITTWFWPFCARLMHSDKDFEVNIHFARSKVTKFSGSLEWNQVKIDIRNAHGKMYSVKDHTVQFSAKNVIEI
jgi:hypothetical protein